MHLYKGLLQLIAVLVVITMNSCRKDFRDNGLETALTPTFVVENISGRTNSYVVRNNTEGFIKTRWDFGNGSGFVDGKEVDTIFYPDAGVYSVKMQVMGKGGVFYDAPARDITVATSDPVAGNLIAGGKMNTEDVAKWTKIVISPGVAFNHVDGKMVATGGSWGHAAIWQKVTVVAGKKYRFGMTVSGSGATETWLEVFFGSIAPVNGVDYSDGGNYISMNTWAGCGTTSFNGPITTIGCEGTLVGKNGEITFTTGGDKYLLIKTGGANLGTTGMAVDNVELRGM
ncbi:hypothetical protein [Flavitalea sp.]|nr:hypothetical protein [Flavitalea sp.]